MSLITNNNRNLYKKFNLKKFNLNRPEQLRWKADNVIIHAGSSFLLPINIEKIGSILTYGFETKDYDINFGIDEEDENGKISVIKPLVRVNSHLSSEQGKIDINNTGKIILKWDNSYSWMTSKILLYTVTLNIPAPTKKDLNERAGYLLFYLELF